MSQNCVYKAFISYRHVEHDRKWAVWLVEKLETFRSPTSITRRGASRRIGRVYRDDDENSAGDDLSAQIESALRASEFLIVVCSPRTPGSKWVSKEIEFFRKLGREKNILVLLVEGEPALSFPPGLLSRDVGAHMADAGTENGPVAADVRPRPGEKKPLTENRAILRIIARLLNVDFDDLFQRERRRQTMKRRIWTGVIVGSLLLFIGAIFGSIAIYNRRNRQTAEFVITKDLLAQKTGADEIVKGGMDTIPAYCTGAGELGIANATDKPIALRIGEYQTDNVADLGVIQPYSYLHFFASPDEGRWIIDDVSAGRQSWGGPNDPVSLFAFETRQCKPGEKAPGEAEARGLKELPLDPKTIDSK